ncbi:MAG: hypothetical protein RJA70_4865, partial [Pseudomonadota bacterium]
MTAPALHAPDSNDEPKGELTLASVYRDHVRHVSRWAARLGGPGLDRDDITHDVFLVVQRKLHEFRGETRLRVWLYRITLHVAQAHRRKSLTRQRLELVYEQSQPVGTQESPAATLERARRRRQLYATLDQLREEYRTVLILFEIEGFSGEEIA